MKAKNDGGYAICDVRIEHGAKGKEHKTKGRANPPVVFHFYNNQNLTSNCHGREPGGGY